MNSDHSTRASGACLDISALRFHGRYATETQAECAARKNKEREAAADSLVTLRASHQRLKDALIHIQQVACSGSPELLIAGEALESAL